MSWQQVMDTPIRAFWSLNSQIGRLRSEEALDQMDLYLIANMNCDGDTMTQIRKSHQDRMGEPMVYEVNHDPSIIENESQHEEGLEKLKSMFGVF